MLETILIGITVTFALLTWGFILLCEKV